MRRVPLFALGVVVMAAVVSACGGSKSASPSTSAATPPPPPTTSTQPTGGNPGTNTGGGTAALKAEAAATATGDIPDNQVFLKFRDPAAGYSIVYPEGWAQSGSGGTVTIRDKNNIIRVVMRNGAAPTLAEVKSEVAKLGGAKITTPPTKMTISGKPAIHVVYATQSAQNPVTGKSVTLGVDRYYLWNGTKVAVVDLGTPVAPVKVDNVDAYRRIIQSFKWR